MAAKAKTIQEHINYFWSKINEIDSFECHSIDDLAKKEVMIHNLRKEFESLPAEIQEAVANSKQSDVQAA